VAPGTTRTRGGVTGDNRRDRDGSAEKTAFVERVVTITVSPRSSRAVAGSASPRWSWWATRRYGRRRLRKGQGGARRSPRASRRPRSTSSRFPAFSARFRIPCRVRRPPVSFCCVRPLRVPASSPVVRCEAVLECAGIHDVLSKSLGSDNAINVVHATVAALRALERPESVAAAVATDRGRGPAALLRARAGRLLMARLKVTQTRSKIGGAAQPAGDPAIARSQAHRRRRGEGGPSEIRGMVQTVRHLVVVEEVD